MSHPQSKVNGAYTSEKRLYVSSMPTHTPKLGIFVRNHWSIESMHWGLDYNLQQDNIKRKSTEYARNPRYHTKNSLLGVLNMERTSQRNNRIRIKA